MGNITFWVLYTKIYWWCFCWHVVLRISMSNFILKYQNALKWLMSILFLFSALIIGMKIDISKIGFITFLLAHLIGISIFYKLRDNPMLFHNVLFAFVDIFSIYRWFEWSTLKEIDCGGLWEPSRWLRVFILWLTFGLHTIFK
jgi:hypothetical protein